MTARLRSLLPAPSDFAGVTRSWRHDVLAGATVAVVALPLALAFGIASGIGAQAGLVTAVVAGFVAALFGGSRVQVSGPTGAMTVVLIPLVARHGPAAVATVGVLAGLLIVTAALFRLGRLVAFIPWPVVEGFTLGIAIVILLQQVPAGLGVGGGNGATPASKALHAVANVTGATGQSLAVVAIVSGVMVLLPKLHRNVPASLIAVAAGTVVANVAHLDLARIGPLPALPRPMLPSLAPSQLSDMFGAALAVAVLAALESLLSAKVADGMTGAARHDPDRELFGQGLANLVTPIFGGMPATGAIARTAVNVRAGARTRLAAMTHSVLLVFVALFGGRLVQSIPLAALAGILAVTAIRMVDVHNVRAVWRATRSDAVVMTATAATTVLFDLIFAIELGIAVAAVLALVQVARSTTLVLDPAVDDADTDEVGEPAALPRQVVTYRIEGALFFGAAQRFLNEVIGIGDVRVVVLRLPASAVLDATGASALGEVIEELEHKHVTVLLKVPGPGHRRTLEAVGALSNLADKGHVFDTLDGAVAHARRHLEGSHAG
jgi:SulP family sulfate permease